MIDERNEREVGDLDDEYTLLGELGRGGSAIVYRARDRVLYRDVAIKVVRPRFASSTDEALARLAREARTVARLQHPSIVTVYAVKQLRDGGLALVMQLVPGRTLKQAVMDDGPFAPDRAESVLHDVADALAYAHAHGVVHRDVKPENIFLEAESGRALLSDFGIAHSTEFDSRLTMDGAAIGTPAYMAPEQIDGAPANARSDLYSLGLVAWEMLTGERPWEGEALYNVIFKQKNEELPAIDELRPGVVPPRLQYIVERMMQKRPSARWAGADGLLAALDHWVVPSDWRQWEDSHRRRRDALKTKARSKTPARDAASMATVRFARPVDGIAPAIGMPLDDVTTAPVTAVPVEEPPDDAPSWATAPARSRAPSWAIFGLCALLIGGGGVATYAQRDKLFAKRVAPATLASDSRAIELPIVSPVATDSQRAADAAAASANGTLINGHSPDGAPAPAVDAVEGAKSRIDSLHRDSLRVEAARADSLRFDYDRRFRFAMKRGADSSHADSLAHLNMQRAARRAEKAAASVAATAAATVSVTGPATVPAAPIAKPIPVPPSPPARTARASVVAPTSTAAPNAAGRAAAATSGESARAEAVRATDDPGVIAAGGRHSCALIGGKVFCWGANDKGQLGDGDVESRESPAPIVGDIAFTQIATGLAHSCGIARGGDAYCWGADDKGQLGDATTTSRSAPVRVAGNLSFRVIRLGLAHSCGLTTAGDVACWGSNANGQVGDGSGASRSSPVVLNAGQRFVSLSAGWNHSCAIATDGTAWCWGANSSGQLGNGARTDTRTPATVSGDLHFTSISAGGTHSCAVTDSGDAYCWGRNSFGQLGTGNTTDATTPTKVDGTTRFVSVTVGGVHSCGRTRGGQVWCWGRNVYGQLGDGTYALRDSPTRVIGGASFASVNATGAHTCGAATDGETFCWGFNVEGQLGDGTRNHSARPTKVTLAGR